MYTPKAMPTPGRKPGAKKPPPETQRESMLAQMKGPRHVNQQGLGTMPGVKPGC